MLTERSTRKARAGKAQIGNEAELAAAFPSFKPYGWQGGQQDAAQAYEEF